jgi:hypothetical protein
MSKVLCVWLQKTLHVDFEVMYSGRNIYWLWGFDMEFVVTKKKPLSMKRAA